MNPAEAGSPVRDQREAIAYRRFRSILRDPHLSTEIVGRVTRLPLDIAADARPLRRRGRPACKHRIDRRAHISSGDRAGFVRTAVVELATVGEAAIAIEEEE